MTGIELELGLEFVQWASFDIPGFDREPVTTTADVLRWVVSVVANFDWAACSFPSAADNYRTTHRFVELVKVL